MKTKLLFTVYLFVWVLATIGYASNSPTSTWTMLDGKTIKGEVLVIKNRQVEFLFTHGSRARISLNAFSRSSQNAITTWAQKQGGSVKFASWIKSPDSVFSKPWPKTVYGPANPQVINILKDSKPGIYRYKSAHYQFISDAKLDIRTVQRFATLFETTYACNMALPLNIPGKYRHKDHLYTIYLFGSYKNYLYNGGSPGSAGVYIPRNQSVLVPLSVLGVSRNRQTKKWMFKDHSGNNVLSHEITHQLMDGVTTAAWYTEGSAEYIAASKYTHAAFHLSNSKNKIFDYVKSQSASMANKGRRLGARVSMPTLEKFMKMSYSQFSNRSEVNRNYGIALLLTYYFYHEDGVNKAANIKNYIKALQRGGNEAEAQKILLNGRSYKTVQDAFQNFCSYQGLSLDFK